MPKAVSKGAAARKSTSARSSRSTAAKATSAKKVAKAARRATVARTPAKKARTPAKAVRKVPAKSAPAKSAAAHARRPASKAKVTPVAAKAPARAARPAKPRAVTDKFLIEQRALLLAERETHNRQAENLKAEAEQLAAEMEPGDIQFDEESGEGATMNVERERDLALSAQARAAVDEIERSLEKIKAGTYGICEQCGQAIPKARLKVLPYAALCVACKSGGLSRR